jgi:hypothetical protein
VIEFQNALHSLIMVFLCTCLKRNIVPYYTDQFISPFVGLLAAVCAERCWPVSSISHLREPLATKLVFLFPIVSEVKVTYVTLFTVMGYLFLLKEYSLDK